MMMKETVQQGTLKSTTDSFHRSSSRLNFRRGRLHHLMNSMFQTEEVNSSLHEDEDEDTNHSSFLQEVEDWNIRNLIDRALLIAVDLEHEDDDATDDTLTFWDVEETKDDECSFSSNSRCEDLTVDSLILTRQRLPDLSRHACLNGETCIIPSVIIPLESGRPTSPKDQEMFLHCTTLEDHGDVVDDDDDDDDDDERLVPLSSAESCEDLATRRRAINPSYNMNHISQCAFRGGDAAARECIPELVRVETDESLQCERDFDDDDDDDEHHYIDGDGNDDGSCVPDESDGLLGDLDDWDPFDDEIDSIAVYKRRMEKQQIYTIDQASRQEWG
jgi:hypothetical protein